MLNCLNDGGKSEDLLDHFHYEDLINSKVEARYRRSTSASGPKGRMNKQGPYLIDLLPITFQ